MHSDLCDFHRTPLLGNKRYVVSFIDDYSKFCYMCLLHTKDESLSSFMIYKTKVEIKIGSKLKRLKNIQRRRIL